LFFAFLPSLLFAFLLASLFFCLITSATTATLSITPAAQTIRAAKTKEPQEQQKQQQEQEQQQQEQEQQQSNYSGKGGTQLGKKLSLCSLGGSRCALSDAPLQLFLVYCFACFHF